MGRRLPPDAFPQLLLEEDWEDAKERGLVEDFHDWQAPYLLTLAGLAPSKRGALERAAGRQALLVHALHRLYPEIVNKEVINKALVEATLRHAEAG